MYDVHTRTQNTELPVTVHVHKYVLYRCVIELPRAIYSNIRNSSSRLGESVDEFATIFSNLIDYIIISILRSKYLFHIFLISHNLHLISHNIFVCGCVHVWD